MVIRKAWKVKKLMSLLDPHKKQLVRKLLLKKSIQLENFLPQGRESSLVLSNNQDKSIFQRILS
jgi:hypothetical protein